MVQYDWKHPEKFYFDVIEYFGGKVNNYVLTYVNDYFADDQDKIKKHLEEIEDFQCDLYKCTYINILANITFNNENKWILCTGCCEYFPIFYPSSLFFSAKKINNENTNVDDSEDDHYESFINVRYEILEKCINDLFYVAHNNKICNCCKEPATYTCKECDNADYCDECYNDHKYEKIHMKKIDKSYKSSKNQSKTDHADGLCDVCGKCRPTYTSDKLYCLCDNCFTNNPHRNHQLTLIEKQTHLMDKDQVQNTLKKSFYYHFAIFVLKNLVFEDKKNNKLQNLWLNYEGNDEVCRIFSCENPAVIKFIKSKMKIKPKVLQELRSIELEFQNIFDKIIRKYFVFDFRIFEYLIKSAHDILLFCSDENAIKFYKSSLRFVSASEAKLKNVCLRTQT